MTILWCLVGLMALYLAAHWVVTFKINRGIFHYRYHWWVARWLRQREYVAITIGCMCFVARSDVLLTPEQERHERTHHHQWRVRPFFAPVYVFWLLIRGYDKHHDEAEARREAGESDR